MAAPGRATDCTEAFREGVKEFCAENITTLAKLVAIEMRTQQAELMAIRDTPKGEPHDHNG